jgi:hypothetical protein
MPTIPIVITARSNAPEVFGQTAAAARRMGDAVEAVSGNVKGTDAALQKIGSSAGASFGRAEISANNYWAAVDKAKSKTEGLTRSMEGIRNAGAALAVAGSGALLLATNLAKMGSDVEESENLVKESFGSSLKAAQDWSQGLQDSLGITATEARRNAATFNVMFTSMGLATGEAFNMSKGLTQLAYDMASFYNLSPDEAFEKLRAGITGEAEPLKSLGVLLNETTVSQYAYANGIAATGEKLTEQQKVQARYGLILQQTTKAQGDLARTMDSSANSARRAEAAGERAGQAIGKGAAAAKKEFDNLAGSLLSVVSQSDVTAEKFGEVGYYVSLLATGIGGATGLVAQIGLAKIGFDAMGLSGTAAFAKITLAANTSKLAIMSALATPLGAAVAGLGLGAAGYSALAASGALGEDAPGLGEALSNTWARLTGGEVTEQDGKTRSQKLEEARLALIEKSAQKRLADAVTLLPAGASPSTEGNINSEEGDDETEGTKRSGTRSTRSRATAALRLIEKAKKQREKEAKAAQRAQEKEDKYQSKLADRLSDDRMEVALERLGADFDIQIARLEATKTDKNGAEVDFAIKKLEAQRLLKEADLRASFSDSEAEGNGRAIAAIRARSLLARAGISYDSAKRTPDDDAEARNSLAAAMAAGRLRGSFDRTRRDSGPFGMRGGDYGDGPSFTGSDPRALASGIAMARGAFGNRGGRADGYSERTSGDNSLMATVRSIVKDTLGRTVIQFAPLVLNDQDSGMSGAQLYGGV